MKSIALIALVAVTTIVSAQTFITNNGIPVVNDADIVVNGDWINDAGTFIKHTGTITTTAGWTNNGTLEGGGKFILNYTNDHAFIPGSNAIRYLVKSGTGSALVFRSIHISDTLQISGGTIKLNATDTLLIKSGGLLSSSNNSYVEGKFAHQGTGTKLYPIGRDGMYLPITIHKMQASKATAVVEAAPAGYVKGGGVEALIDFPYAWRVSENVTTDTAAYIELGYPNSLPVVSNPIVVRSVQGSIYASMGARLISEAGGYVNVKSYSRGLNGLYSIASGFPSNFETDSLALVSMYQSTNGANWKTKTNWLAGNVSEWSGVTMTGQSITSIDLSGNNLTGSVEDPLVDILSLQTINLSNNKITSIPAFVENPEITLLDVSGNKLDFGSLEANAGLLTPEITFNYINQAELGTPLDTLVKVGTPYEAIAQTAGINNSYQWKRKNENVAGANAKAYRIESIGRNNMGEYVCEISNTLFPALTLRTAKQNALAVAELSGRLFAQTTNPAEKGQMTLFKITEEGKYDTTAVKNINPDGSYLFEKIVLDDYQLLGFVDTLFYEHALPTYYKKSIFWEDAETIVVNSDLSELNVTSDYVPVDVEKGVGLISGTFEDEVEEASRIESARRVSGAGASVRRVENAAKPMAEKLTLVAYVFTNEEGEFVLPELPKGDYRLNIQYPGYPMDESSFINITIGDGLKSQVRVAANVQENKIVVREQLVTGLKGEHISIQTYPNPSTDFVLIDFATPSFTRSLEVINASGSKVITQPANEIRNTIDVRQLSSGIYMLRALDSGTPLKIFRLMIK